MESRVFRKHLTKISRTRTCERARRGKIAFKIVLMTIKRILDQSANWLSVATGTQQSLSIITHFSATCMCTKLPMPMMQSPLRKHLNNRCAHQARAGHVASRGGKSGLSNKPIFPQPLCFSLKLLLSEEPEAHASGACLLL